MAVVVDMTFADSTIADYDAVMTEAGLDGATIADIPGAIAHFAFEQDGSLRVIDVWESAEQWQSFTASTIGPAAARRGLVINPDVAISDVHNSIL